MTIDSSLVGGLEHQVYALWPELPWEFKRPAWHADAACRGAGPELWFPPRGKAIDGAVEVCNRCPVRAQCLEYAMEHDLIGIWGGKSEKARNRAKSRRARHRGLSPSDVGLPDHGRGEREYGRNVCEYCGQPFVRRSPQHTYCTAQCYEDSRPA